jgi:hypothetical protein
MYCKLLSIILIIIFGEEEKSNVLNGMSGLKNLLRTMKMENKTYVIVNRKGIMVAMIDLENDNIIEKDGYLVVEWNDEKHHFKKSLFGQKILVMEED